MTVGFGHFNKLRSWRIVLFSVASLATVNMASAQQQVYVYSPGTSRPSVIVDLGVLDRLGPEPTLPGLLRSQRDTAPSVAPRSSLLPPPASPPQSTLSLPSGLASQQRNVAPAPVRPSQVVQPPSRVAKVPAQAPKAPAPAPAVSRTAKTVKAPTLAPPPAPQITAPPPAPRISAPAPAPRVTAPRAPAIPKASAPRVAAVPVPAAPKVAPPAVPSPPKVAQAPKPVARPAAPPPPPAVVPPAPKVTPPPAPRASAPTPVPKAAPILARTPPPPAPVPAPQIASRSAPDAPTQTASDGTISIGFTVDSSELPGSAVSPLDTLIGQMKNDSDIRVRLNGYASTADDSPSQARRISLFRALAVRTYMMQNGIRSTRIDIHALGDKSEQGDQNRVDVVIRGS